MQSVASWTEGGGGRLAPARGAAAGVRWRVALALTAVSLIWGSTYLAMRVGLETLPPFLMAGSRFLVAGAVLYGALRLGGAPRPTGREWWAAARVGALLLVVGNGFIAVSQRWVSSGLAAVVVSTIPLWVAVLTAVPALGRRDAPGEAEGRTSRLEWAGLLVGFAGAALLHAGGELGASSPGALLVLLGPVGWALGTIYARRLPLPRGFMATAAEMLTGGVMLLVLSPLVGERLSAPPSMRSLVAVAYLVVLGSLVAFSAFGYLVRAARPAVATSYAYICPLIALALGSALGGERAAPTTWLSAAIIVTGLVIVRRAQARGPP